MKKSKNNDTNLNIRIDSSLLDALKKKAAADGITASKAVRLALSEYVRGDKK